MPIMASYICIINVYYNRRNMYTTRTFTLVYPVHIWVIYTYTTMRPREYRLFTSKNFRHASLLPRVHLRAVILAKHAARILSVSVFPRPRCYMFRQAVISPVRPNKDRCCYCRVIIGNEFPFRKETTPPPPFYV